MRRRASAAASSGNSLGWRDGVESPALGAFLPAIARALLARLWRFPYNRDCVVAAPPPAPPGHWRQLGQGLVQRRFDARTSSSFAASIGSCSARERARPISLALTERLEALGATIGLSGHRAARSGAVVRQWRAGRATGVASRVRPPIPTATRRCRCCASPGCASCETIPVSLSYAAPAPPPRHLDFALGRAVRSFNLCAGRASC